MGGRAFPPTFVFFFPFTSEIDVDVTIGCGVAASQRGADLEIYDVFARFVWHCVGTWDSDRVGVENVHHQRVM